VQNVERGHRDGGSQRIAAERAAVIARMEDLHYVVRRDECRHGKQPAA